MILINAWVTTEIENSLVINPMLTAEVSHET